LQHAILAGALSAIALVSPEVRAQQSAPQGFALGRFQPAPAGDSMFGVESPYTVGGERALHVMLLADYAHGPLIVRSASDGRTLGAIVRSQVLLHLDASLVLARRLTLNVDMPAAFQAGDAPSGPGYTFAQPTAVAFGDLRLGARVAILGDPADP